jgi:LysR family nitrogen assimilation transcriptional regulator
VSLSISEGLSTAMREGLIQGRLNLAVLYNAQPSPELELLPLLEEELVLVQKRPPDLAEDPPPGPIRLRDVAHLPLVIPSRPNAIRMKVESEMALLGCRPQIALEMDGVAAILELVADRTGHALLSRHAVTHHINPSALSVRRICEPQLRTRLVLACSALRPATLTQQAAHALMQRVIKEKI